MDFRNNIGCQSELPTSFGALGTDAPGHHPLLIFLASFRKSVIFENHVYYLQYPNMGLVMIGAGGRHIFWQEMTEATAEYWSKIFHQHKFQAS